MCLNSFGVLPAEAVFTSPAGGSTPPTGKVGVTEEIDGVDDEGGGGEGDFHGRTGLELRRRRLSARVEGGGGGSSGDLGCVDTRPLRCCLASWSLSENISKLDRLGGRINDLA